MRPFPAYRAAGLLVATNNDVAFLWSEARRYFVLAAQTADPKTAERLSRLGSAFASMSVSLLCEITRAHQEITGQ